MAVTDLIERLPYSWQGGVGKTMPETLELPPTTEKLRRKVTTFIGGAVVTSCLGLISAAKVASCALWHANDASQRLNKWHQSSRGVDHIALL